MQHFDLCVIGSGSGNSVAGKEFRDVRVAIVDGAPWFGGTCLNAGCIPSKMLTHPADVAEAARRAGVLGVEVSGVRVRWADLRARVVARVDAGAATTEGGDQLGGQAGPLRLSRAGDDREASVQVEGEGRLTRLDDQPFEVHVGSIGTSAAR